MIVIACSSCTSAMRIAGDPTEVEYLVGPRCDLWPDRFVCPTCKAPAAGFLDQEVAEQTRGILRVREVTAMEAFTALNGLGFPEEQDCTEEKIQGLLKEHPIRRVHGKNIPGTERFALDHMELWDGTKLYFGAGREGAVIYRIVKPPSYAERTHG